MTFVAVRCPHCQSDQSVKRGQNGSRNPALPLPAHPGVPRAVFCSTMATAGACLRSSTQIIDMRLNASGVRDTARSAAHQSRHGAERTQEGEGVLESVNTALLHTLTPETVAVDIMQAGEAEMDEM